MLHRLFPSLSFPGVIFDIICGSCSRGHRGHLGYSGNWCRSIWFGYVSCSWVRWSNHKIWLLSMESHLIWNCPLRRCETQKSPQRLGSVATAKHACGAQACFHITKETLEWILNSIPYASLKESSFVVSLEDGYSSRGYVKMLQKLFDRLPDIHLAFVKS